MNSLSFLRLEAVRQASNKDPSERTVADIDALCEALCTVVFFSRLDEETVRKLAKCVTYEAFAAKQKVFSFGDYGDKYYLLLTGRVGIEVPIPQNGGGVAMLQVAVLEPGAGFGEMALLEDQPRSATVEALEASETLSLYREHYQELAMEKHKEVFHNNVSFLQRLPFLDGCPTSDIKALAEQLVEKTYSGPEVIVRQGQEANQVILVKRGSVLVLRTVHLGPRGSVRPGKASVAPRHISALPFCQEKESTSGHAARESSVENGSRSSSSKHTYGGSPKGAYSTIKNTQRSGAGAKQPLSRGDRGRGTSAVSHREPNSQRSQTSRDDKDNRRKDQSSGFNDTRNAGALGTRGPASKKLVLQVATLGKLSTYGAREILEGEKAAAVQNRGNVYSATLVAFPAAQIFVMDKRQFLKALTEPLRLCFGAASSMLPSDKTLLEHYAQSVRWERYKASLMEEIPKVERFERARLWKPIREWELPPKPSSFSWNAVVNCVSVPIHHRQSLSYVTCPQRQKHSDDEESDAEAFASEALNKVSHAVK